MASSPERLEVFEPKSISYDAPWRGQNDLRMSRQTLCLAQRASAATVGIHFPTQARAPYTSIIAGDTWSDFSMVSGSESATFNVPMELTQGYSRVIAAIKIMSDSKYAFRMRLNTTTMAGASSKDGFVSKEFRVWQPLAEDAWKFSSSGFAHDSIWQATARCEIAPTLPADRRVLVKPQIKLSAGDSSGTAIDVFPSTFCFYIIAVSLLEQADIAADGA